MSDLATPFRFRRRLTDVIAGRCNSNNEEVGGASLGRPSAETRAKANRKYVHNQPNVRGSQQLIERTKGDKVQSLLTYEKN